MEASPSWKYTELSNAQWVEMEFMSPFFMFFMSILWYFFTYENDDRKVDSNRCGEERSLTDPIQEHKDTLSLDQEVEHYRMHI